MRTSGNCVQKVPEYSTNTIPQFAPMIPEKRTSTESKQVSQKQSLLADDSRDEEWHKLAHKTAEMKADIDTLKQNKDLVKVTTISFAASVSTPIKENPVNDKGGSPAIEQNNTPPQKQRKKKHRPKVIREGKPKKSPKSVTPKPSSSKETPTGKRKYIRRNVLNKTSTPPTQGRGESTEPEVPKHKSCKRGLNFDLEGQSSDDTSVCTFSKTIVSESQQQDLCTQIVQSKPIEQQDGLEGMVELTEVRIAYDLDCQCSMSQLTKDCILSERKATKTSTEYSLPQSKRADDSEKDNGIGRQSPVSGSTVQESLKEIKLQFDPQLSSRLYDSISTTSNLIDEKTVVFKRKCFHTIKHYEAGTHNSLQAVQKQSLVDFPNTYKRRRTKVVLNSATHAASFCLTAAENVVTQATCPQIVAKEIPDEWNAGYRVSVTQLNKTTIVPEHEETDRGLQDKLQSTECSQALSHSEKLTGRRSSGHNFIVNSDSPPWIVKCNTQLISSIEHLSVYNDMQRVENSQRPHMCRDFQNEEGHTIMARKKQTMNNCFTNSIASGAPSEVSWQQLLHEFDMAYQPNNLGTSLKGRNFRNKEQNVILPYNMQQQDHNALVIYRRNGTIVPYEGSLVPVKRRRPRPKVDNDEETNRVWKLLMENASSEGIDGMNEEKIRWWEEERRVFCGRADSFIARMRLVQGDRRFSQWKGSVLDSVIGVFLTQNVSDHLSSSAFMSLAAHFPLKSRSNHKSSYEEGTNLIVEPEVYTLSPVCEQSYITVQREEKDGDSKESSGSNTEWFSSRKESELKLSTSSESGRETYNDSAFEIMSDIARTTEACSLSKHGRETYNTISSQTSAVSPQDSVDSPISKSIKNIEPYLERTSSTGDLSNLSKVKSLDGSTSFVELLHYAEISAVQSIDNQAGGNVLSQDQSEYDAWNQSGVTYDNQRKNMSQSDSSKSFLRDPLNHSSEHPSSVSKPECFQMCKEEKQPSIVSDNKVEHALIADEVFMVESAIQPTIQATFGADIKEVTRCSSNASNNIQWEQNLYKNQSNLFIETQESEDVREAAHSHSKHDYSPINEMNAATTQSTRKRVGKEKYNDFNWDNLRKQAEAEGRKGERTIITMDSLDWEAVRSADVDEVANAIKGRGMNNVLAKRIKDFLNRLVTDHGSFDLEWLRDVPPDQAKEYLLSVRGLGLKSVECVRLLTLHHLAFPVDTNVGRIAVRLGWVPLQPLPESLQLHLLEMYPMQESIQKYLWPRLCKLDQKTLYELHYQMITFGKVFCTKSKPNCNACPMRGECRHFASAFASARLALPAPDEKSIASAGESKTADLNFTRIGDQQSLPLLQATKQFKENTQTKSSYQFDAEYEVSSCKPIIEEPTTPEPEGTQIMENDIEDAFFEDPDEIPMIRLNIEEFTRNLQNYMQENMKLQEDDMSKALVCLTPEAASIPMPKLKNVSRLRTEHQVYELPDYHPLLQKLDRREPDDPCFYLLAIWAPGETANSTESSEGRCTSQEYGKLCEDECFSCRSISEAYSQIVRGTLLIPCRTAMRGSFPLNGTYFQVNEVFADHDSSINPIDVPRAWIWNLPRRTVYFGTSIPTIFNGLTAESIQHCFWRGYVCVRGFDQKTRAPRPLLARLHLPASKLAGSGKKDLSS